MSCTIEKIIADARMLVNRLKDHDSAADSVIGQATVLHKRVEAMKIYQEDLNELNEIARHRPRSALIMNLAQENSQIRELQQENKDLRLALEEHQSALELIMSKYREQVVKLVVANRLDRSSHAAGTENPEVVREKIDKISEMAAVMQRAIMADDDAVAREQEVIQQLKLENKTLRELLHVTVHSSRLCLNEQADTETQTAEGTTDQEGKSHPPDGVVPDSTSVSAATITETGSSSPNTNKTNKTDKKSKDIQNDASKNSPKKNKDEEENKTGTVKRNDKKKDGNKK